LPETQIVAGREQERYYPYTGLFYVNRHSFFSAGQDSWTLPPAQNQDMFAQLLNVEPVLQGVLQRRRGYTLFSNNTVPTTATASPSTAVSSGFGTAWLNPTNILATDGATSTVTINSGNQTTQHLQATNFGFNIPLSSTVVGVAVTVVCSQSSIFKNKPSLTALLLTGGNVFGVPAIFQPQVAPLAAITLNYAPALTAAQINDPSFGVDFSSFWNVTTGDTTFAIDSVTIMVSYSVQSSYTLGYSFRSENLLLREVIFTATNNVLVTSETGQTLIPTLFQPGPNAFRPRMVLSRDFGYFADGVLADYNKFDGTQNANNLTKWGININDIGSLVFGPNDATAATDLGASGTVQAAGPLNCGHAADPGTPNFNNVSWFPIVPVTQPGGSTTSQTISFPGGRTLPLQLTSFGFNIPATATITGIKVSLDRSASVSNCLNDATNFGGQPAGMQLMSAGSPVGAGRFGGSIWPATLVTQTYGSPSDLWGTTWTPALINSSQFGFQLIVQNNSGSTGASATVYASSSVTVYFTVPSGLSWSNPNGSFSNNPGTPATALASTTATSDLRNTAFGLLPTATNTITGIQVTISAKTSGTPISLNPILVKAGVPAGLRKVATVSSTGFAPVTFGSSTDLWGGTWLGSDINGVASFGVQYNASTATGSATISIDRVQITVYTVAGPLTFTTNTSTTKIVLLNGRTYFYAFQNSKTGHASTISPPSLTTGPLPGNQVNLANIPTSTDPQVDTVLILATADGNDQTTLYLVASLPNGTSTYNDTTPDTLTTLVTSGPALLTNLLYQDTDVFGGLHGIANNNPPPAINFPTKHKGRIFGSIGQTLYFSKNLDEVTTANGLITGKWEEAWPATNQIDVSEFAETIQGLMSDGETLWLATERCIRRLIGDSPSNFQKPEIQFNETGLLNQDCWKVTFFEGQPVGTVWLTPDFKVMGSDFNTYLDIGTEIQDVLNTINPAAVSTIHAAYVSKGPADYYMLYIPTGTNTTPDTVCVLNLRAKKWFIWLPTDNATASLFFFDVTGASRWLFASTAGPIYEWSGGVFQDRIGNVPVTYPVTIQTSWLDMGDYNIRKFVNQIIPTTGDNTALTVQVDGASNEQDFNTPLSVVPATVVTPAAIPDDVFVPLASGPSHNRAFRFTFISPPSTIQNVLTGFAVEAGSFHRY
jgi:hypothetical protein